MTKSFTPADDRVGRLECANIEIEEFCRELFEHKCRCSGSIPSNKVRIEIIIRAFNKELKASPVDVSIPNPILFSSSGRLTGKVEGHEVCVSADGKGHFRARVDGKLYGRLPSELVKKVLGIEVQKKTAGGASEPIPRAVWRHLANSYNLFDRTVEYDKEYDEELFEAETN